LPRALNRGLAVARAPLVARHDADDVSHPQRLERQFAFLRDHPECVLLGAQVRIRSPRGWILRPPAWRRAVTDMAIRFQSLFDNPFVHSSTMFRCGVVRDELGGYDPAFASGEDFDLWSRTMARHPVGNLPGRLVDFRVHPSSTAAQFDAEHVGRNAAILERNLRTVLALDDVPARWPRVLAGLQTDPRLCGPIDGGELVAILGAICDRFRACHPGVSDDREVRRVGATKWGQIACLLASRQRRAAFAAFARASRLDARTASRFTTRFAALLGLGRHVRPVNTRAGGSSRHLGKP
jgi:glycosyltransferase involved in cell wall biosynthesis